MKLEVWILASNRLYNIVDNGSRYHFLPGRYEKGIHWMALLRRLYSSGSYMREQWSQSRDRPAASALRRLSENKSRAIMSELYNIRKHTLCCLCTVILITPLLERVNLKKVFCCHLIQNGCAPCCKYKFIKILIKFLKVSRNAILQIPISLYFACPAFYWFWCYYRPS